LINEGKLSFIQKIKEFYLIYLSESDSPKFLSDSTIHEFNQRSFIPLGVSTLRLIFHSWKCDVYQFPFHLLLCFHFLVLNNCSNFLLVSIPTMIDQSNKSNVVDSHHLIFRAWLSRFGIGKEVYYTKCLTEGHPCLVAFDYGSENNVMSQRLVEKLQLTTTFHLDQAWIKMAMCERSIMWYCSHGLLSSSYGMGMASF